MHCGIVTYGDIIANDGGTSGVGDVNARTILHVGAVADGDGGGDHLAGLVQNLRLENDVQLGQVGAPQEIADGGHDHVVDQGRGDFAEGGGDDNADGHIHHVAPADEFLEFSDKAFCFLFCVCHDARPFFLSSVSW